MLKYQEKKKIFILGNPSNNLGDEAAMKGIVYGIHDLIPDASIALSYAGSSDITSIREFVDVFFDDSEFFTKETIIKFMIQSFYHKKTELMNCFFESDIVVIAPGGCGIHMWNRSKWLKLYLFLITCKIHKKKVMFHACSVGPFNKKHQLLLRRVLNSPSVISLRDETSYEELIKTKIKFNKTFYITSDSALMIPIKKANIKKTLKEKIILGITPIDVSFFGDNKIRNATHSVIETFSALINKLHDEGFIEKLMFISHIPFSEKEIKVVDEIIAKCSEDIDYVKVNHNTAEAAIEAYNEIDFCIAARHHSGAFALKMGVPAICIAYEHKAHGFFRQCNLDEYVIDIDKLTYEELLEKTKKAFSKYDEIVRNIDLYMPVMEENAFKNTKLISKILTQEENKDAV